MHSSCIRYIFSFLFWVMMCYVLSFSLSDRPHHGTQSAQIHSNSESSSRFQVFFFLILLAPPPHSVLGWEGPKGLLGELLEMWRSFGMPGYPVGFCRQSSSCCHWNLRLGISTWETLEVSCRVYTRVLLQYIRFRYLCTSVCYYI